MSRCGDSRPSRADPDQPMAAAESAYPVGLCSTDESLIHQTHHGVIVAGRRAESLIRLSGLAAPKPAAAFGQAQDQRNHVWGNRFQPWAALANEQSEGSGDSSEAIRRVPPVTVQFRIIRRRVAGRAGACRTRFALSAMDHPNRNLPWPQGAVALSRSTSRPVESRTAAVRRMGDRLRRAAPQRSPPIGHRS
jgi:hypothetical protein